MEFNYNVTGERRKALVTTISEVLGMKAVYKGMPTAAYAIDNLTVTKEGTLIADERTDEATLNKVLATLADAGFTTEAPDGADAEEPTGLVISMPMDGFSEVIGIDDTGSLMVHWDNGSELNVLYGIDRCRIITE